jgi:hypothetical protein
MLSYFQGVVEEDVMYESGYIMRCEPRRLSNVNKLLNGLLPNLYIS